MKPPSTPTSWDRVLQTVLNVFLWNLRRRKKLKKVEMWNSEKKTFILIVGYILSIPASPQNVFLRSKAICSNTLQCFSIYSMSLSMHCCLKKDRPVGFLSTISSPAGREEPTTKGKLEQIANACRTAVIQSSFWYLWIDYFAKWNLWLDFILSISVPNCKSHMYRKVLGNLSCTRD